MTKMDMNKMLQQVQQMQEEMAKAQDELANEIVEASVGGGMVKVKASGAGEIVEIIISAEVIDPDDPEGLADLVLAGVNQALKSSQDLMQSKLGGAMGGLKGLGLPGLYAEWAGVFSPLVDNLIAQLSRFPGVGTRTAQRLAFHILRVPNEEAFALADAIREVKERIGFCRECGNLTEEELCTICADARRDRSIICVVEQPADLLSVERTHEYRGVYHVLGGALSPLDGVEPSHLRIDELLRRVERNGVEEVVLATNPNMTGEATAAYLADRLRERTRVTRLASGLPVGGDLEYADEVTLGRALSGRREM